jgi:two-component system cell cycle sensor histidine kinase/response regulator CckA
MRTRHSVEHLAGYGGTILVIDDEEPTRTEVCRILRREGYTAIPARRGLEAQWCVERHGMELDLLLADLAHPEADAYHVGIPLDLLRPHTPIVFMSTAAREENIRRGLLHPRAPFLRKPFPPYVLTRAIRNVLARWDPPPPA